MKTLVFIINSLAGGGAEKVASVLLNNRLFSERYKVDLILLEKDDSFSIDKKVTLHKITTLTKRASQFSKFLNFPLMLKKVWKIKRVIKPNYSLSFLTRSNLINILTKTNNERILIGVHNNMERYFEIYRGKAIIQKPIIKFLYNRVDRIIAVSEGLKSSLQKIAGVKPDKITVINNPFDIETIKKMAKEELSVSHKKIFANKKIIVTIGRLTYQKAFHILINAFNIVRKYQDVQLLIIGEGELEDELKIQLRSLGLAKYVHFLGWQDNPFKFLSKSALFVLSSLYEGFGNVLVEAMVCGCPVVSTNCKYGPREILGDSEYGLLAKVSDVDDLANKILTMLTDKTLREHYIMLAKKRVMDFSADKIVEEYIKVIES